MKDWMTIGQISEATGLSIKALRLYEEKGILKSSRRNDNDYRVYTNTELKRALQVKEMRELGFSISEIAEMIQADEALNKVTLASFLSGKLNSLLLDQKKLNDQVNQLNSLLTSINKSRELSRPQRRYIMEEVLQQSKQGLAQRGVLVSKALEDKLKNEIQMSESKLFSEMMKNLDQIKKVADSLNMTMGPGRGSAAASYLLFSKGFNHIFPEKYELYPDLFYVAPEPLIWLDVPSSQAEAFMQELGQSLTVKELKESKIYIFKCPFLDILENLQTVIGPIEFEKYEDDSKEVLAPFQNVNLKNIFLFDLPKRSLMNANSDIDFLIRERELKKQVEKSLQSFKVQSVDDILNIMTLSFPIGNKEKMLDLYFSQNSWEECQKLVPQELHYIFKSTKGLLLYREQVIQLISHYTKWSVGECNQFYLQVRKKQEVQNWNQYQALVPDTVKNFIDANIEATFLKSHMVAMWWFVKRSAIASSLYPDEYQAILDQWSQSHHGAWSDLGFIDKDYHPLAMYW